jgi:hypothetical protein
VPVASSPARFPLRPAIGGIGDLITKRQGLPKATIGAEDVALRVVRCEPVLGIATLDGDGRSFEDIAAGREASAAA